MSRTPEIEKRFVHQVYDAIAPHFSATRFAIWPAVASFLGALPAGSLVLDAGCGNGKYLFSHPSSLFLGCDICPPLARICAARGAEALVADATRLPLRPLLCDAALSIAVLHHLSTEPRRRAAVAELVRVLRPAGRALITVWAREQEDQSKLAKWAPLQEAAAPPRPARPLDRIPEEDQEFLVPWHVPFHRAEVGSAAAADGLARRDDRKGAVVFDRYYHVFKQGELQRLVEGVENAVIVDQFYDKSNWLFFF
ncbi:S-adenosyl-L-methionine-dependent methyltransferases superfamily protein isoform X2 [Wolffia australiana]